MHFVPYFQYLWIDLLLIYFNEMINQFLIFLIDWIPINSRFSYFFRRNCLFLSDYVTSEISIFIFGNLLLAFAIRILFASFSFC